MMKISIGQPYSFYLKGQRPYQEDARYPDADKPDRSQRVFVVCDGVGGCEHGELASKIVCESFRDTLAKQELREGTLTMERLSAVLGEAYDALDRAAGKDHVDMATTMTLVCLHAEGCTMAHIGDSRIYHIRPEKGILYKSDDHSLVNSMVHAGMLTPEEAINHPQGNVITRYMGPTEEDQSRCMATVTVTTDLKAGDYLLMCTDGVLHCLSDDDFVEICSSGESDQDKVNFMAKHCAISEDNSTMMLIPIAHVEGEQETAIAVDGNQVVQITMEVEPRSKERKGLLHHLKRLFR